MREKDIQGKRFGRLVALKKIGKANSHGALWLCKCDCGNLKETRTGYLNGGGVYSCGCLRSELSRALMSRSAEWNTKHGHCRRKKVDPLYWVWNGMRERCRNPNNTSYKNYGARGISVCEEWNDFEAFRDFALKSGYKHGLAIDRVDADGDYCPQNCRFVTQAENNSNKRNTVWLTVNGVRKRLVEWADETGQKRQTLHYRRKSGWSDAEVVFGRRQRVTAT